MAQRTPTGVTWLHADHLGSTTETTGQATSEQLYYPYGAQRTAARVSANYRYTGQRWEEAIGLYDYKARYYDPALGRFIQPDKIVPEPGNPQAPNRYSYCVNNPVRYVDTTGHWWADTHLYGTMLWGTSVGREIARHAHLGLVGSSKVMFELPRRIAVANLAVDLEAWGPAANDFLSGYDLHHTAKTPSVDLGGAIPEQYYHYPSKDDAVTRLHAAIDAKDPGAFGRALHSYQDYYAHTLNGFTALPYDFASIIQNCPECLQSVPLRDLLDRAVIAGHGSYTWDWGDEMMNGTQWYTFLFM